VRQFRKYGCLTAALLSGWISSTGSAFFLDGNGFYGARGELRTNPGASADRGTYRAIDQTFRLELEGRASEKSSFFSELRVFEDPRAAYMGDTAQPTSCRAGSDEKCKGANQDTSEPGYKKYTPQIAKLYAQHAFEYCLLDIGRRDRQWGMGLFLDAGRTPFDTSASTFDGVSCHVNMQKAQTLGFTVGFDQLSETGSSVVLPGSKDEVSQIQGPTSRGGVLNQLYFTIEYDDRQSQLTSSTFAKQVGVYVAKLGSANLDAGGTSTDLTFVDLYSGFYMGKFSLRSEVLFRLGKTGDPNVSRLGGALQDQNDVAVNNMQSIGGTATLDWVLFQSGQQIGPENYHQGDLVRHLLFTGITYAPGAAQGYYSGSDATVGDQQRTAATKAMSFNRNFHPALILFNGRRDIDDLTVDGVFDPTRVMNANVYTLGYRYENLQYGNFETRLVYAALNESMPEDVHTFYSNKTRKKVGYYGSALGYELDTKYSIRIDKGVDWGVSAGYLMAGDAWRIDEDHRPVGQTLLQTHIVLNF
jgi:hypothetical protein